MDSGSQNSNNVSRHFREKHTTPDDVLPSPAEIIPDDYNAVLNYVNLDGEPQKLEYRNLAKLDPMPVPMPVDREHYGTLENSAHYWATGHGDWLNVCEAIERYMDLTGKTQPLRLMDFGCATGRFLRHSYVFGKEKIDNWGCDFAPTNVAWSKQHLTPEIKIILNSSTPHLPFADGFFDVVTAFSVFTHINLLEDAWLLELRRITKPNGLLYLTIQNEATSHVPRQRCAGEFGTDRGTFPSAAAAATNSISYVEGGCLQPKRMDVQRLHPSKLVALFRDS